MPNPEDSSSTKVDGSMTDTASTEKRVKSFELRVIAVLAAKVTTATSVSSWVQAEVSRSASAELSGQLNALTDRMRIEWRRDIEREDTMSRNEVQALVMGLAGKADLAPIRETQARILTELQNLKETVQELKK